MRAEEQDGKHAQARMRQTLFLLIMKNAMILLQAYEWQQHHNPGHDTPQPQKWEDFTIKWQNVSVLHA